MRCPECGFHSFDYLDHCKKCGIDLTACKQRLRLSGPQPVAPPAVDKSAAPLQATIAPPLEPDELEEEEIDFGFDILQEPADPSPQPSDGEHPLRALPDSDLPTATARANNDDLDFDDPFTGKDDFPASQPFPGISELDLTQPFPEECEQLPDDDLPKLDHRS